MRLGDGLIAGLLEPGRALPGQFGAEPQLSDGDNEMTAGRPSRSGQ